MASRLLPGRVTAPSLMLVIRGAPRGGAVYRARPLGTSKLGTAGPGEAGEETEGAAQEGHLVGGKREEPRNSLLTLASVASQLLQCPSDYPQGRVWGHPAPLSDTSSESL